MGRDEHNHSKGKNRFAQTPKNQLAHEIDVEFSDELDQNDKKAQARAYEADKRVRED